MNGRIASTKTKERNLVFRQIDVRSNQFVSSRSLHDPLMSHRLDMLLIRRAANENHLSLRPRRVVQRPSFRNHPTPRRDFVTSPILLPNRIDVLRRLLLYTAKIFKMFPEPHTAFPASVIAFNRSLETRFSRRHEHRRHAQTQATSNHLAERIRPASTLKHCRIVELGVVRQTEFRPMFQHLSHRVFSGHTTHRSRANQAAVQRNGIQYVKYRPSLNAQVLDAVFIVRGELIEFGVFLHELFQVPSRRRGLASFSNSFVKRSVPFQYSVDRRLGRNVRTNRTLYFRNTEIHGEWHPLRARRVRFPL